MHRVTKRLTSTGLPGALQAQVEQEPYSHKVRRSLTVTRLPAVSQAQGYQPSQAHGYQKLIREKASMSLTGVRLPGASHRDNVIETRR
jgi:hypothetical protein